MTLTQLLAVLVFTPVSSFTQLGNPSLIRGHPLHAAQGQPPPDVAVSRRAALGTVFHGALLGLASQLVVSEPAFAASGIGAQAERGAAEYGSLEKIEEYAAAIKACRRAVANPEIEVKAKRKDVERTISRVVEPLIDAMLLNELSFELSDAQLAKGAALPQEMKSHLTELKYFVKDATGFDLYKGTYKGGHVERELEELVDTATEYISIARSVS